MSSLYIVIIILLVSGLLYTGLILVFTIGWTRLKRTDSAAGNLIHISVLIPFRNEEENIKDLFSILLSQDYQSEYYEVIMINDHSDDNTTQIIQDSITNDKIRLLELGEGAGGKKNAVSLGVKYARGDLIATLDADCRPGKKWLQSIANAYAEQRCVLLSAPVAIYKPVGFVGKFQALEFLSLIGSGGGAIGSGFPIMCNGANLVYEKSAFEEVGGYAGNEHIPGGDDIFLLEKIKKTFGSKKIGFIKDSEAIVSTEVISSWKAFWDQRIRWVSKSPAYRDTAIVFTALVVLVFNLSLLISLVMSFFNQDLLLIFFLLLLLKTIVDFPILKMITSFSKQSKLLLWYLPFQMIYFIFISFSGIFGNLLSYKWKGR